MSQPRDYTRQFNFKDYQATTPADPLPGTQVDAELNAVKLTLDDLNTNIAKVQRDDGKLGNQAVHKDAFDPGALALINVTGFTPQGDWTTGRSYAVGDIVDFNSGTYLATAAHTSSSAFATDNTANRWILIANAAISGTSSAVDKFEGDGTTTVFTLTYTYASTTSIQVFVNGELLNPTDDYTISGNQLTLFTAPGLPTVSGNENVIVWGASVVGQAAADAASASASNASGFADEADNWARKTTGLVESADYSSKAYAIGGTGVDAGSGSAKDWATKTSSTVGNTSEYSAKYWATQGNVPIVATNISDVNTVAGISSNVTTVSGISGNVTTVAGVSAAVTTVAGISSNVTAVAGDAADIGTVAADLGGSDTIGTVAGSITNVNTVASNVSDVSTVSGVSGNVTTVAGISSNVTTVAGISANVTTVAGQTTNLQNVTDNLSAIQNAGTNATNAASSATAAASSQTAAAASQVAAAASASSAANSFDSFDDRYLGVKNSDPTTDNDGDALASGMLYFSSSENIMKVYDGASWIAATSAGNVSLTTYQYSASGGQTTFSGSDANSATLSYTVNNILVTLNGSLLFNGTDYTATNGTSVVLASGAVASDVLQVTAFKSFTTADMVPASTGGTFSGNVTVSGDVKINSGGTHVGSIKNVSSDFVIQSIISDQNIIFKGNDGGSVINALSLDMSENGVANFAAGANFEGDISITAATNAKLTINDNVGEVGSGNLAFQASNSAGSALKPMGFRAEDIRFAVSSSEVLRIASNGDVGYGKSSPGNPGWARNVHIHGSGNGGGLKLTDNTSGSGNNDGLDIASYQGHAYFINRENATMRFHTNDAEKARLDADGHFYVGTSDSQPPTNNDASGICLRSDGKVAASRSNGISGDFNTGADGEVVWFRKAGTETGKIAISGNDFKIFGSVSNIGGIQFGHSKMMPMKSGSLSNGGTDLGSSSYRWKDLYLSGGVYLGGTGSANKLDDYEEGTFTPTFGDGNGTHQAVTGAAGRYTKIGQRVFVEATFVRNNTTGTDGNLRVGSLPFTSSSNSSATFVTGHMWIDNGGPSTGAGDEVGAAYLGGGSTSVLGVKSTTSAQQANIRYFQYSQVTNGRPVSISLVYRTDS